MYAIIEDGSRQYKVLENQTIEVDLRDSADQPSSIEFDKVLLVGDESGEQSVRVGQPWIDGAKVLARVEEEIKGRKITVIKFLRRKGYHKKQGHRQRYLRVTIEKIET